MKQQAQQLVKDINEIGQGCDKKYNVITYILNEVLTNNPGKLTLLDLTKLNDNTLEGMVSKQSEIRTEPEPEPEIHTTESSAKLSAKLSDELIKELEDLSKKITVMDELGTVTEICVRIIRKNIDKEIIFKENEKYSNEELIKGLSHIVENKYLTNDEYLKKQYARLERIREGTEESHSFVRFE